MPKNYRLVVGCPLSGRDWMIERWFDYILNALNNLEQQVDFAFAFVIDREDPVIDRVNKYLEENELIGYCYEVDPFPIPTKDHNWNIFKYEYMVDIRNSLLHLVQKIEPDYFLSLDSDILLHPQAVNGMIQIISSYDAVGSKTYLHRSNKLPNYAMLNRDGNMLRPEVTGVIPVDVLMAIKLMGKEAYSTPYAVDRRGEDIGWSLNCSRRGLKFVFDGRYPSKHIMEPSQMLSVDRRVGY